jgi:hypothetical protein
MRNDCDSCRKPVNGKASRFFHIAIRLIVLSIIVFAVYEQFFK